MLQIILLSVAALAFIIGVIVYKNKRADSEPVSSSIGGSYPVAIDESENMESTEEVEIKSPIIRVNPKGDPKKVALLFGINRCDPLVYYGDALTLKGCVNDAKSFYNYLVKQKFGKIYYNVDSDATISNFLRVWKDATKDLKDGDTLLLQMSRHGMSLDQNVMENDVEQSTPQYSGDQAAVMYDGVIVDDCFWRLFMDLPKIKLIFINDSCHSGSQYKVASIPVPGNERKYRKSKGVSRDYLPKKDNVLDVAQLEKAFGKPTNKDQKFDLISISGCQDNETSADAYIGGKYAGALTYCLLSSLYTYPKKTLRELQVVLNQSIKANGFEQNPKVIIEGDQNLYDQPLFS